MKQYLSQSSEFRAIYYTVLTELLLKNASENSKGFFTTAAAES